MTQIDNAIRDVERAVQEVEHIVTYFRIDYAPDLPIIVQSAIQVLDKAIRDLHSLLEGVKHD